MAVAKVSINYIKSIINESLIKKESEEVSLGGYTFSYPECQFVVTVKGVYEPVIKKNLRGEIYFETESLKISDHPQDPGGQAGTHHDRETAHKSAESALRSGHRLSLSGGVREAGAGTPQFPA